MAKPTCDGSKGATFGDQPVESRKLSLYKPIVFRLTTQKSYAFCVLAMKQRVKENCLKLSYFSLQRLGPCSDPPVTLVGPLRPSYVVQNLRLVYKTSQSVQIRWDYQGPVQVGFYIKQMGQKSYLDQDLVDKSMVKLILLALISPSDNL